ncbi:hypothetical protein AAC387_Pa04g2366 [Persea americana]
MFLYLFLGFLLGALAVIVAEASALLIVLDRLGRRKNQSITSESEVGRDLDGEQSLDFARNKKGVIWVLESDKVSPRETIVKLAAEQKSKKEIVEVFPVKKNARIKDHSLILTNSDDSQATVELVGCVIVTVSSSSLPSRKWAKRYPIIVENKESAIYNGSNSFYIFLETSWEKESWCKALRLASCIDKDRVNWYLKLREEFHRYLSSLNEQYPSFMKPAAGFGETTDSGIKIDGSSSKVRHLLKKLAKKASRSGADCKTGATSSVARDERRVSDKFRSNQDKMSGNSFSKSASERSVQGSLEEEDTMLPLPLTLNHSSSQGQMSSLSDGDGDEKFGNDEGTLCWNLLFSRLFFDAKRSTDLNNFIQARVQRILSNMRTPSFIRRITCTGLNLGKLPPYIHNMRVLPMDMKEVWSMEVDLDYLGGVILYIETRLEVCEPDFQKGLVSTSMEPSTAEEANSDLLEGFEYYGDQLNLSRGIAEKIDKRDDGDQLDGMKNPKSTGWKSRWKSVLNSIADQVSQVPLSLAIKVTSLRGTVRLHIKPPPSDHLWFGFTSMPDIDWNLESAVGERKITNSHIALLISNRFKAAIRETLVLPNCEGISIPWMLAEKDDWVPRKVAPFIWVRQESSDSTVRTASDSQPGELKTKGSKQEEDHKNAKNVVSQQADESSSSSQSDSAPSVSNYRSLNSNAIEDLKLPLLQGDEKQDSCVTSRPVIAEFSGGRMVVAAEEQIPLKRIGRRARMMDLGKKMGEKLEEKRRHIEEKGRHMVEKMRGHDT